MTKNKRKWRWKTRYHLWRAGWRPGRNIWGEIQLPPSFPEMERAKDCLAEFGGLKVGTPTDYMLIEPMLAEAVSDLILKFQAQVDSVLYPLGIQQHQDREYVLMDSDGLVFVMNTFDDNCKAELNPVGSSFDKFLEHFVIGASCQKEIIADLRSAELQSKSWQIA